MCISISVFVRALLSSTTHYYIYQLRDGDKQDLLLVPLSSFSNYCVIWSLFFQLSEHLEVLLLYHLLRLLLPALHTHVHSMVTMSFTFNYELSCWPLPPWAPVLPLPAKVAALLYSNHWRWWLGGHEVSPLWSHLGGWNNVAEIWGGGWQLAQQGWKHKNETNPYSRGVDSRYMRMEGFFNSSPAISVFGKARLYFY
jgi:hypothetical protein